MKQVLPVINEPSSSPKSSAKVLVPQSSDGRRDLRWLMRQVGHAAWSVQALATGRVPSDCFYFFGGIGDELLCTAVFHELGHRGRPPVRMMSSRPTLFENNPDVDRLIPLDPRGIELAERLGRRVVSLNYALPYEPAEDRHPAPPYPIIGRMCELAGLTGDVSLRPYFFLSDDEKRAGKVARRQVAIVSSGLSARHTMLNKQWGAERFQAVVDLLAGRFDFVQVGDREDPPLSGALDLRGRTTLRETAAVLSQSLLLVGHVGLLMHLARAVDCRGVIVFGGREHPTQSGYECNENLYTPVPCAPCWKYNACDYDRECLRRIQPHEVAAAAEQAAGRHGTALETGTYTITENRPGEREV